MRVMYDVSIISDALRSNIQTGIFRVVEATSGLLANQKECQVEFSSQRNAPATNAYLRARFPERSLEIKCAAPRVRLNTLYEEANYRVWNAEPKKASWRVWRKALGVFQKAFNKTEQVIDPGSLADTDVYHSSFYPIPAQVHAAKHVRSLVTVYDIIPILHPELFNNEPNHVMHRVLASIGPDDCVVAISEATKNDVCGHLNMDPARVFVTPLAADRALFYPCHDDGERQAVRTKYGIPDAPYVLTLGTLEPRKNMDHVIRCFARLCCEPAYNGINLVLTGAKGWDYDRIFGAMSQLPALKERIVWTGRVDDADLAALYSGAQAFTYMSLYEGFGLPPLEAMQCGVPVITSNTSSLPEVVGDAGLMFDPADEDGLCQALLELNCKEQRRAQMAQQSLERAKLFSWERCGQDTLSAYRQAMGK